MTGTALVSTVVPVRGTIGCFFVVAVFRRDTFFLLVIFLRGFPEVFFDTDAAGFLRGLLEAFFLFVAAMLSPPARIEDRAICSMHSAAAVRSDLS